jgi:hypothetical protein
MEAAHTSETSVYNYFTQQYIPEDKSELHTRRRENLKSHKIVHYRVNNSSPLCGMLSGIHAVHIIASCFR